jgi:hypothetical protein
MDGPRNVIVVLDESGTHAGSLAIAVAGFAIYEDRQSVLETEWRQVLDAFGIQKLHMKDFVPPHGKYAGKTAGERSELFKKLIETIHKHSLFGIGAAIELTKFMKTTYASALLKAPHLVDSPYHQCITHCVLQAAQWADAQDDKIQFQYVIEKGCAGSGRVQSVLHQLKGTKDLWKSLRIDELRFATKKDFQLTECADFLAYEMYKEVDRTLSESLRQPRSSLVALIREGDQIITVPRSALQNHLARGGAVIEAMTQYLPPEERFRVECFGLRSLDDERRELVFSVKPYLRDVWRRCLATGEMGVKLADVDPKLLPPDELVPELMKNTVFGQIMAGNIKVE